MNRFIQIFFAVAACIFCESELRAQVFDFGAGYAAGIALGEMGETMDPAHAFHLEGSVKFDRIPFSFGLSVTAGRYDRHRSDIDFELEENFFIRAPLIVNHRLTLLSVPMKYDLTPPSAFTPYLSLRASLGMLSSYAQVRDPDVSQGAEGIVNIWEESLHRSSTFVLSPGAGVRFDIADVLRSIRREKLYIDAEVNWHLGGRVSYAFSERQTERGSGTVDPEENGFELIDHGYHRTEKFRSQLSMLGLRIGVMYRFDVSTAR